jgi:predicted nucleic acid-binding Zn ribbon protein
MRRKSRPQPIGEILAELVTSRGYVRMISTEALERAWAEAAGEFFARHTRIGAIRRGTLEVLTANSTLVQELAYQKQELLGRLARLVPDEKLTNLWFRVGRIEPR